MFKSLAGSTAVITGASKGIGRGIAHRLGAVGCSVLVVARNTVESESAAREITEAGGRASAFSADVANESETKAMAAAAVDRYGRLDILCANAGIFPAAKLDAMSGSEFDTVLATNLRGTFPPFSSMRSKA
jgi:3-oxoacyl-[acyl-carrier protein] reductase